MKYRKNRVLAQSKKFPSPPSVLKDSFVYSFYKIGVHLKRALDRSLKDHGIGMTQLAMMEVLKEFGPHTQNKLGAMVGVDQVSMVRFLDGLEARGFLTRKRNGNDRRQKFLSLTGKGTKTLNRLIRLRASTEKAFFESLSEPERALLIKTISKLG